VRNYRTGLFRNTRFRKRQKFYFFAFFAIPCSEVCICSSSPTCPANVSFAGYVFCQPLPHFFSMSVESEEVGYCLPLSAQSIGTYSFPVYRFPIWHHLDTVLRRKSGRMHLFNCTFCLHSFRILRIQIPGLSHKELSFFCNLLTNSISNLKFHKESRLPH